MASSLLALIDDIATLLDDVSVMTTVATKIVPDKNAIAAKLKADREHNVAVKKRMDAGEDCEHELIPEPAWAHLERGENSIRIKPT